MQLAVLVYAKGINWDVVGVYSNPHQLERAFKTDINNQATKPGDYVVFEGTTDQDPDEFESEAATIWLENNL